MSRGLALRRATAAQGAALPDADANVRARGGRASVGRMGKGTAIRGMVALLQSLESRAERVPGPTVRTLTSQAFGPRPEVGAALITQSAAHCLRAEGPQCNSLG